MATKHRKDMTKNDFDVLHSFSSALLKLKDRDNCESIIILVGKGKIFLPVWYKTGFGYSLSKYKSFEEELIGISVKNFRRVASYIGVKEAQLIYVLYRFSIIGVTSETGLLAPPKFRVPVEGLVMGSRENIKLKIAEGFLLEKRRALGDFTKKQNI